MKKFLALLAAAVLMAFSATAFAAYDLKIDDDTFAKFGVKGQWQYLMKNPDTANHDRVDMSLANARIYASGQITNMVKFGFNFDAASAGTAAGGGRATDAFITLDMAKELKIMNGIYRMAVTRKALQDTYAVMFVTQPEVAAASFLSSGLGGYRNAGATIWGDVAGKIRYNVGFWDGEYTPTNSDYDPVASGVQSLQSIATGTNTFQDTNKNDEIGMSARVVFNFLDPEAGYTCSGCYLGKAKIANIGLGYFTQDYRISGADLTYSVTTVDAYYDANNMTAEAGYFKYDYDSDETPTAWYVELGYAIDKIQPAFRYESWDGDGGSTDYTKMTAAVNYMLDGHNAKITLEYAMKDLDTETATAKDTDTAALQLQIQF